MKRKKYAVGSLADPRNVRSYQRVADADLAPERLQIGNSVGHGVRVALLPAKEAVRILGQLPDSAIDIQKQNAVSLFHQRIGNQTSRAERHLALGRKSACKNCNFHMFTPVFNRLLS